MLCGKVCSIAAYISFKYTTTTFNNWYLFEQIVKFFETVCNFFFCVRTLSKCLVAFFFCSQKFNFLWKHLKFVHFYSFRENVEVSAYAASIMFWMHHSPFRSFQKMWWEFEKDFWRRLCSYVSIGYTMTKLKAWWFSYARIIQKSIAVRERNNLWWINHIHILNPFIISFLIFTFCPSLSLSRSLFARLTDLIIFGRQWHIS